MPLLRMVEVVLRRATSSRLQPCLSECLSGGCLKLSVTRQCLRLASPTLLILLLRDPALLKASNKTELEYSIRVPSPSRSSRFLSLPGAARLLASLFGWTLVLPTGRSKGNTFAQGATTGNTSALGALTTKKEDNRQHVRTPRLVARRPGGTYESARRVLCGARLCAVSLSEGASSTVAKSSHLPRWSHDQSHAW